MLIGQFVRFYGPDWYANRAVWPTWDGIIPWGTFFVYLRTMWRVMALERVQKAQAGLHAVVLTTGGKSATTVADSMMRKWLREAQVD